LVPETTTELLRMSGRTVRLLLNSSAPICEVVAPAGAPGAAALLAARARFGLAAAAAPDHWSMAAVRELDNAGVTRGASVDALVHPLFPVALVV
jgi:hypothetical protein